MAMLVTDRQTTIDRITVANNYTLAQCVARKKRVHTDLSNFPTDVGYI